MSLINFAARCPHCNHEFTIRVDAEKIKNKKGRVTCSSCKESCQIEGEGAYYLAPVVSPEKTNPPVEIKTQSKQPEPTIIKEKVVPYATVPVDEPQYEPENERQYEPQFKPEYEPTETQKDEPDGEPESEASFIDALAFVSVVLTGIVLIPLVAGLFSDTFSVQAAYENTVSQFSRGIGNVLIVGIFGLIVGSIATAIVVGITKLEVRVAANILGAIALCFPIYGYLISFSEGPSNSANGNPKGIENTSWFLSIEGDSFRLDVNEGYAVATFDGEETLRRVFKPVANDSDNKVFMGKPSFLWVADLSVESSMFGEPADALFYLVNDQCLIGDMDFGDDSPMKYCMVRQ